MLANFSLRVRRSTRHLSAFAGTILDQTTNITENENSCSTHKQPPESPSQQQYKPRATTTVKKKWWGKDVSKSIDYFNTIDGLEAEQNSTIPKEPLLRYLRANIAGFPPNSDIELYDFSISGCSNPPVVIKCTATDEMYALRTPRAPAWHSSGKSPASEIKKQFQFVSLLAEHSTVPVPKMLSFCADPNIIGSEFYVMQFVRGRVFRGVFMDFTTMGDAAVRYEMIAELARVLSELHSIDIERNNAFEAFRNSDVHIGFSTAALKCFADGFQFVKRGSGNSEIVERFRKRFSETVFSEDRDFEGKENRLTESTHFWHDFHWENIIWHPTENKILALVDWENPTVDNPCAVLAFFAALGFRDGQGFILEEAKDLFIELYLNGLRETGKIALDKINAIEKCLARDWEYYAMFPSFNLFNSAVWEKDGRG